MSRRSPIVYGLLLIAWLAIMGWQVIEHRRVKEAARAALIQRARAITTSLGVLIRSQIRFGGIMFQERLESALSELAKTGQPKSVALLNAAGEIVAFAGDRVPTDYLDLNRGSVYWGQNSVTLVNLVDLGTNVVNQGQSGRPIIVLPRRNPDGNEDWRDDPRSRRRPNRPDTNAPPDDPEHREHHDDNEDGLHSREPDRDRDRDRDRFRRPPFGRPPWMSEEEFKELIAKQGLHSFVMVMSTESLRTAIADDLWLRAMICLFGAVAASGLALAWRNVEKSSQLQIRLVRAAELNTHLKEMNIAAAGLAHETRNPLNIIRGLAQMISKQTDASPEIRAKSREITDEVDRVSAQLSEFINYSKPREVRRTPINLNSAIRDVVRTLDCDLEEKAVRLTVLGDQLTVEADEQLLRQVLFNLLINAVQAVDPGGHIQVVSKKVNAEEASLEISDDGPGVPIELRKEIFKPYFTAQKNGTGLGLAVVQQIVLAHGWSIECLGNTPRGAVFLISGLKISPRA